MTDFHYYLITDPTYYSNDIIQFKKTLQSAIENRRVDIACFRDKTSNNFKELAQVFLAVCKEKNVKNIFINQNIELAKELNFDGVHLTSLQFDKIEQAKEAKLKTIISCHTFQEIEKAISLGVNKVTYSPIFFTPNKGEPKGIEKLCEAVEKYDIDIIALGGIISEEDITEVKDSGAKGFASIRYFV